MMKENYIQAVRLLLKVAPVVFKDSAFALKGGTAINLFIRDLPRLSVDLDLVLTDHTLPQNRALRKISELLNKAREELEQVGQIHCELGSTDQGSEVKLFVEESSVRIKIEVNHVFRGTILPTEVRSLSQRTQDTFFVELSLPVLHPDELYGSKLVAAMDRQHPRDLFDVLGLFENDGLTPGIVEAFVCYLAGHNRPIHEVLFGNKIDMALPFRSEFSGMTRKQVTLDSLLHARDRLFDELPNSLTADHREFLLGLGQLGPDWGMMKCPHLRELPAIRWKLQNLKQLRKINPIKFKTQAEELANKLSNLS